MESYNFGERIGYIFKSCVNACINESCKVNAKLLQVVSDYREEAISVESLFSRKENKREDIVLGECEHLKLNASKRLPELQSIFFLVAMRYLHGKLVLLCEIRAKWYVESGRNETVGNCVASLLP